MHSIRPIGLLIAMLSSSAALSAEQNFIPTPKTVEPGTGSISLTDQSRIVFADPILKPLADVLVDEIALSTGLHLKSTNVEFHPGDVVLRLDARLNGESYRLESDSTLSVSGGNYDAVAFGSSTLLQAIESNGTTVSVPKLRLSDEPAYPFRAALIDLARKYHSPGGIEQVIELCRLYRIRYLQVHLTDDQLFMFPSAKFPQLGKGNSEFARFEPGSAPHISPYSREELEHLEAFASARGVHIIPELDLPGHSGRLVGDAPEIFGFPGGGATVDIASPKTIEAVGVLLNEVMDIFKSTPYIHLGADEVGLGGLENTPEYKQAVKDDPAITSPHDLYCKFIVGLHDLVAKRGKKSIVWEEAWNTTGPFALPKDTVVMVWSQGRNPNEIARSGYSVVNATWTPLYIVRGNRKSAQFLYKWSVDQFGREGSEEFTRLEDPSRLLGAQLCSWENSESIEIQSLRHRLAIVAEKTWNAHVPAGLAPFESRFAKTDALVEKLVNPIHIQIDGRFVDEENTFAEPIILTPAAREARPDLSIRYTLDNSLPNSQWKHYDGPIKLEQTAYLRAGLFDSSGLLQGNLVGGWYRRITIVKPNLATNKPVTVGPGPDRTDGWFARLAVDGHADDPNAHWASSDPAPQWLQVDLEKVCAVDSIDLITFWDGSRYYQWTAEGSIDGKTWKTLVDSSTNTAPATAAGYAKLFPQAQARYIRINMLKNSANPFVHIVELIINGPTK